MKRFILPAYIFWPLAYLATLAVSVMVLWWVILIGGKPFILRDTATLDAMGVPSEAFKKGSVVGVRREVCSDTAVRIHIFPELRSASGLSFPLTPSLVDVHKGCSVLVYGFALPPLQPGMYALVSTARFQNNLVGRDEYTSFLPIPMEILP